MGAEDRLEAGSAVHIDVQDDSKVSSHPLRFHLPIVVEPTDDPKKRSTVRPPLVTVGSFRLPGICFDFDSTFPRPEAACGRRPGPQDAQ